MINKSETNIMGEIRSFRFFSLTGLFFGFIIYPIFSRLFEASTIIFILFFMLLLLIYMVVLKKKYSLILFIFPLVLLKIYYYFNLDPLTTSDEIDYYNYALFFYNSNQIIHDLIAQFLLHSSIDIFAFVEPLIGFFYSSIISLSDSLDPKIVYIINFSVLLLAVGSYSQINNNYKNVGIYILGWAVFSPYLSYWGSHFFKDYISLFFIIYSLRFYIKKSYFLCLLFIIVATGIRSYSIVIFAIYYLYWYRSIKLTLLCAIISFITSLFLYPGVLLKFVQVFCYFIFSPNPMKTENYDLIMGAQIIEAILIFFILFFGFIQKDSRKIVINTLCCLSIYASCIYMVDNRLTYSWGLSQDTITENYHRKKIPVFPLLIFTSVYILNRKKCEVIFK